LKFLFTSTRHGSLPLDDDDGGGSGSNVVYELANNDESVNGFYSLPTSRLRTRYYLQKFAVLISLACRGAFNEAEHGTNLEDTQQVLFCGSFFHCDLCSLEERVLRIARDAWREIIAYATACKTREKYVKSTKKSLCRYLPWNARIRF